MPASTSFFPHGMCYSWQQNVLLLHVLSDALIAVAYFSIPFVLVYLVRRRPDLPFLSVFRMFSAFIVSCGLTHVASIVVIWNPIYWVEGVIKAMTALLSIMTACVLVPLLPKILALRTPAELERVNAELQATAVQADRLLRSFEREHYIATTLQTASLGELPAQLGILELSAVYEPAGSDLEIGGDWYDAFELSDGRIVISIGDVAGKGLAASISMAKMRQAIRVAAQLELHPGAILDAADRALRMDAYDQFVTAFVGIIDDTEGTILYANAGHPPPIVRRGDGSLYSFELGGLPLGLRSREDREVAHSANLELGSIIVLYTDGLTESTHDYFLGDHRVRVALESAECENSQNLARYLRDTVLFDGAVDDVAILCIHVRGERRQTISSTFSIDDQGAARETRIAMSRLLAGRGADEAATLNAEIIYSELIGNVARYCGGVVDVHLKWRSSSVVLHFLDRGPGFQYVPRGRIDSFSERGRGLFIIEQLSEEFTVSRRAAGGSHARVVLKMRSDDILSRSTEPAVSSPAP